MRFHYLPQRVVPTPAAPNLDVLYRPVVPVRFHGPNGSTKMRALLDTGADECYITETIAAELGVTPVSDRRSTIHSASGKISVWYGSVVIEVRG